MRKILAGIFLFLIPPLALAGTPLTRTNFPGIYAMKVDKKKSAKFLSENNPDTDLEKVVFPRYIIRFDSSPHLDWVYLNHRKKINKEGLLTLFSAADDTLLSPGDSPSVQLNFGLYSFDEEPGSPSHHIVDALSGASLPESFFEADDFLLSATFYKPKKTNEVISFLIPKKTTVEKLEKGALFRGMIHQKIPIFLTFKMKRYASLSEELADENKSSEDDGSDAEGAQEWTNLNKPQMDYLDTLESKAESKVETQKNKQDE